MTLMGGAAASVTLIGGYMCTKGGCSTPQKQPRENTVHTYLQYLLFSTLTSEFTGECDRECKAGK